MKRIIIGLTIIAAAVFTGCKDDSPTPINPSPMSNFTATPGTGAPDAADAKGTIKLTWQNPTEGNFFYSQLQYTDPVSGDFKKINFSHFAKSELLLTGLYKMNGPYTFKIYPVSSTNTFGEPLEVTATSKKVPPVVTDILTKIPLAVDQLAAYPEGVTDTGEGSLAGLLDGNLDTYWHENWHTAIDHPQGWTIKLGQEVDNVRIRTTTRKHSSVHAIGNGQVYVSNDPDTVSDDDATWTLVLDSDVLKFPTGNAAQYDTPDVTLPDNAKFRRLKLNVLTTVSSYWCYSELSVHSVVYDIFEPDKDMPED